MTMQYLDRLDKFLHKRKHGRATHALYTINTLNAFLLSGKIIHVSLSDMK